MRLGSGPSPLATRHGSLRRWRPYQASDAARSGRFLFCFPRMGREDVFCSAPGCYAHSHLDDRAPPHGQARPQLCQTASRPSRQGRRRQLHAAGLCVGRAGDTLDRNCRRRNRRAQRADQNPMAARFPLASLCQKRGSIGVGAAGGHAGAAGRRPGSIEIWHLAQVICERVNRFLGWRAVERIALRQAPLRRSAPSPAPAVDAAAAARIAARPSGDRGRGLASGARPARRGGETPLIEPPPCHRATA